MLFNRLPVCGLWFYDAVYSWQELPHRSGRPPSLRRRPALPGFLFPSTWQPWRIISVRVACQGIGFKVEGVGYRVWGLGFEVYDLRLGFRLYG